jgi:hypothetical protein
MASFPTPERTELTQDLAVVVQSRHEQFAVLVASGLSYREAARRAGYNPDNSWRLMRTQAIQDRVAELVREPEERVRAGIELELVMLRNRAANGDLTDADRADIELRLKLLLAHAKIRGWIVNKREVKKASLSLFGKLSRAEMHEMLLEQLSELSPGERARIEAIASGADEPPSVEGDS